MDITITTKSFNLHELTSTSCYLNFCKDGVENNETIKFIIKDESITSFIDCLTLLSFRTNMLFQNNALHLDATNPIIAGRMRSFARTIQMVKEILGAVSQHPDFNIDDLNKA